MKKLLKRFGSTLLVFTMLCTMAPKVSARDSESTRKGTGVYPLYWTAYEPCFTEDAPLSEERWKANVDWVAENLLPYGYNMVTTDGWLGGSTQTTENGYLLKYNDEWEHDWAYWADYCRSKGLEMGVYYNPLWIIDAVANDPTKTVIGTDIPISDIYTAGFADNTKEGAKEYIQGYVKYFKDMGVRFLRIDFLCWYETGAGSGGAPSGVPAWGSENYATALSWIEEAAGDDMEISLVMPNSLNHGYNEAKYGDLMRVDTDTTNGDWTWLNCGSFGDERQTWIDRFCQWANPFQGLTGFSDIGGRGNLTLDGDFLRIHNFTGQYADNEKRAAISLFTMAGAPIAVADQYDTIGDNLSYYTNPEILALKQEGFVGKPIYYSGDPFEPEVSGEVDTGSRDSERWIGQTSTGDWVVALFNRSETEVTKSIDLNGYLGLENGGYVHDIWQHTNLGCMTKYSVTLQPHDVSMILVTPNRSDATVIRYEAEVASYQNGAHFNNNHSGHSGGGFVDQLGTDYVGSDVLFGVYADYAGPHKISVRYANALGTDASATIKVVREDNTVVDTGTLPLPNLSSWNEWNTATTTLNLAKGLNLISVGHEENDIGSFSLDCIDVYTAPLINAGFESGDITGWEANSSFYGVDDSDAYNGNYKCYFWSEDAFEQSIHQTVQLPNGNYIVTAMVKQDTGTPLSCSMDLNGGSQTNSVAIPHGSDYEQISGMVAVANGELTISFNEKTSGYTNLQIDDVTIAPCVGDENYGFESGTLSGWTTTGSNCGVDSSDAFQGSYKCYFWNDVDFEQQVTKTYTGIDNGLHSVTAWVKQYAGTPETCQMIVSNGNEQTYSIIPHADDYVQISALVYVTNNQLSVTFQEIGSNCNLQIDNVVVR